MASAYLRELGTAIRHVRLRRGLTLDHLAEASDLSAKHLGEIERGRVNPTIGTLRAIARALDVSLRELL